GVETNVLKKMGAFYSYGETRLGQGRENARTFLQENEDLAQEIEALVRTAAAETPLAMTGKPSKFAKDKKAASDDEDEDEEEE
ncbi:MAG: hypothetical protein AB7T32_02110, partial [Dehalococcoidia bacterium]